MRSITLEQLQANLVLNSMIEADQFVSFSLGAVMKNSIGEQDDLNSMFENMELNSQSDHE